MAQTAAQRSAAAKKAAQTRKLRAQERAADQARAAVAQKANNAQAALDASAHTLAEEADNARATISNARTSIAEASSSAGTQLKSTGQTVLDAATAGQDYVQAETLAHVHHLRDRVERLSARSLGLGLAIGDRLSKTAAVWSAPTNWKQEAEHWETAGRSKRQRLLSSAESRINQYTHH